VGDVIGLTSEHSDAEDVFRNRHEELEMMQDMGLVFDTDPAQTDGKGTEQTSAAPGAVADDGGGSEPPEDGSDQPGKDDQSDE
jgi:hypothetical protein